MPQTLLESPRDGILVLDDPLQEERELKPSERKGESVIRRGKEVLFQAFNWESHKKRWWHFLGERIPQLAEAGFTSTWLPPVVDSLAPEGYLPKDLYCLNSAYGSMTELQDLIHKIHVHGLRVMADIVINHRVGSAKGVGGLYNRYDGLSLPWDEHAVTSDSGGHGNPSTGEIFHGVSNIDHTKEFVVRDLKEWLKWLRKGVGFDDFRFDYAKGYKAKFVKGYIEASEPDFAIGEYWDTCNYNYCHLDYNQDSHRQRLVDWIDGTGGLAAAFDFTTKAVLQEAVKRGEWWRLRDSRGKPPGVMGMWPSRAVTFIDNHDTGSTQAHWPFPSEHVLLGYAYILTHPGIPTVFYDHFFDWGSSIQDSIRKLIAIRKLQGIHSRSSIEILEANNTFYAAIIGGNVCIKIGDGFWKPHDDVWDLLTWGNKYALWQKQT